MSEQHVALCARIEPDLADRVFFTPGGRARPRAEDVEFAKSLCEACPLRQTCLDEALTTPERYDRYGIRAGLLPVERKALRARLKVVIKSTGEEWIGGPVGDVRQRSS
jgi:WhiB family transcriptional regulator, redox-sensing transcriptional regulator